MDTFIGEAFLTNHMIVVNDTDTISKRKPLKLPGAKGSSRSPMRRSPSKARRSG